MNKKQLHDFTVTYLSHSPKAIRVQYEGEEYWLPFSEVEMEDDPEEMTRGYDFVITVPDWLVVEKGMDT